MYKRNIKRMEKAAELLRTSLEDFNFLKYDKIGLSAEFNKDLELFVFTIYTTDILKFRMQIEKDLPCLGSSSNNGITYQCFDNFILEVVEVKP